MLVRSLSCNIVLISYFLRLADIVVWDSHPLALGATPKQVYIDGIPQFKDPVVSTKASSLQKAPSVPNFEKESQTALEHDGLPPLQPRLSIPGTIVFRNVSSVWERDGWKIVQASNQGNNVVVKAGEIACRGDCASIIAESPRPLEVDLRGGSISPALVSFGSQLGLQDIPMEESTTDGAVADPLSVKIPGILEGSIINAADGLQFATRDALCVLSTALKGVKPNKGCFAGWRIVQVYRHLSPLRPLMASFPD